MDEMKEKMITLITDVYGSQSECSKALGWPRQRLNKLICGTKEPDVTELYALATALNCDVGTIADIFLLYWSPNGQLTA